jgi:hypothetical protein
MYSVATRRLALAALVFVPALAALPACQEKDMTRGEAATAVSEASLESDAHSVTNVAIELSTRFTIGKALADAAAELRAFLTAEVPCAKITIVENTITTEWGVSGVCTYHGVSLTGTSKVTIARNDDGTVQVDHAWTDLSNGRVKVSGTANVTWSKVAASRHVVHDLYWTRLSDGKKGHGTGDRTQRLLDPSQGLAGGIGVDGNRSFTTDRGTWHLAITGIEARLSDPCPYAGKYTLTNPENKLMTLEFTRRDEYTIVAEVNAGKMHFTFTVHTAGASAGSVSDA